mmetsp:Transcript_22697/g.40533  ORF Transcript_22697/g.40533 Transcript_22697/m.40533 type:complete len:116 (-) Transcript_22697:36-383(-)
MAEVAVCLAWYVAHGPEPKLKENAEFTSGRICESNLGPWSQGNRYVSRHNPAIHGQQICTADKKSCVLPTWPTRYLECRSGNTSPQIFIGNPNFKSSLLVNSANGQQEQRPDFEL